MSDLRAGGAMPSLAPDVVAGSGLASQYQSVRALSQALVAPLSDADATIQSMADASPAKWHLAHTTWFFETFILRDHVPSHRLFDADWPFLFNSYYEAEGQRMNRAARGMLSRPTLAQVLDWRAAVDEALLRAMPDLPPMARDLVRLGCQHEQQHQELLLTDILHAFSTNPLEPALWPAHAAAPIGDTRPQGWIEGPNGLCEIGHDAASADFAFDCEGPRHRVFLAPHALADRVVTNGEWIAFIQDGGYDEARLWLSDGWAWRQANGVTAPLYWRREQGGWTRFGLDGRRPIDPAAPVCHISLYEADAFATWAGARLPTEAEWEARASGHDPASGNQLDGAGAVQPLPATATPGFFGDVWEWTGSAYRPYPGFRAAPGAVGEYNGKFMSGQFILRGGSCATPRGHMRASYRNFFYPQQRWQFMGLRLARDL